MDRLPEEILLRIFKLLVSQVEQLAKVSQVSKRFYRITQDPKLWYLSFQKRYPIWGSRIQYASNSERLIDWKDFVIHLIKQQNSTKDFTFQFVNEQVVANTATAAGRKRKLQSDEDIDMIIDKYFLQKKTMATHEDDYEKRQAPFWIQDPLVVDIDRITKKGVVATGKHRKNVTANRSEHKILFWEYPSWKLIRSFELNLTPPNLTCQIIGIQSILMPTTTGKPNNTKKARFFSLAVGMALIHEFEQADIEDRVDIWKSLFIYRLFDDGSTQCVSHIKVADIFLGREIFLFSDTSWCRSSDGNHHNNNSNKDNQLIDWLKIVSPKDAQFDARFTVFLLAIGPIYDCITGCVQLAKFDIRGQHNILDPSITSVHWDPTLGQIAPLRRDHFNYYNCSNPSNFVFGNPTEVITTIRLGSDVSCMIHFKYPPTLNHLICTGSYLDDELSVYDWRFGIKVGSLPWKSLDQTIIPPPPPPPQHLNNDIPNATDDETNPTMDVRPWGLESTLVLPPYWSNDEPVDLSKRGFRLIAVGDNRSDNSRDKLEIKVWDISYLLQVNWNPLKSTGKTESEWDLSYKFPWWPRRTKELEILALNMMQQSLEDSATNVSSTHDLTTTTTTTATTITTISTTTLTTNTTTLTAANTNNYRSIALNTNNNNIPPHLPYSPPIGFQSMLLSHTFDKEEEEGGDDNMIPVKYTAYNVLYTSLFLLTEDGKVTVMDIETGKITGTVQNVAATESQNQVRGIDVNVIAGKEVVVTSKEGLLRGVVH